MNIRTIQKTGGKSFTITLPKNWVVRNKLENKGRVSVVDDKKRVLITPEISLGEKIPPICRIDGMNRSKIFRQIISYYLSGVNEIIVKAKKISSFQRAAVREVADTLIGMECLESTSNQQILKCAPQQTFEKTEEFLGKIISSVIAMYEDTLHYLHHHDKAMAMDIIERDIEIDRVDLSIIRSFNIHLNAFCGEEGGKNGIFKSYYYHQISARMERIANHIVRIARYFLIINKNEIGEFNQSEKDAMEGGLKNLLMCSHIIRKINIKKAHLYLDSFERLMRIDINKKYKNRHVLNLVIGESISRINGHIAKIAEETINCNNAELAHFG